ncbi:hypothetical protein BDU57DRAFT_257511 [Ampelomyces quisqualis]|uniref:Uncharacterized protein n=1 Tax=Ampelomyces quisqualis TaxID=50730 RepID=A0A6A5QQK9_AMPQU|nr:hypothetical protein BDU57DRAFT_257511 [Ampelomyces quisqualis]
MRLPPTTLRRLEDSGISIFAYLPVGKAMSMAAMVLNQSHLIAVGMVLYTVRERSRYRPWNGAL